jgi:hypothetical protein
MDNMVSLLPEWYKNDDSEKIDNYNDNGDAPLE